jgi:hypothetical protein
MSIVTVYRWVIGNLLMTSPGLAVTSGAEILRLPRMLERLAPCWISIRSRLRMSLDDYYY